MFMKWWGDVQTLSRIQPIQVVFGYNYIGVTKYRADFFTGLLSMPKTEIFQKKKTPIEKLMQDIIKIHPKLSHL